MVPKFLEWPCSRSLPGVKEMVLLLCWIAVIQFESQKICSVQYTYVFQNYLER
jgi:hypothetical protein